MFYLPRSLQTLIAIYRYLSLPRIRLFLARRKASARNRRNR